MSEFGQEVQGEIDLYVTNNRLNEASFRRKFDPILKIVIKNQNPIELLFKDLKHFDTQNPVTGNLNPEVDIGKKKDLSKFLSHAPDVKDLELQSRLNKLRSKNEFFNSGDDNNINNYPFILPSPLPQLLQPPYVPPPLPFQLPNLSDLFSKNRPPLPPLPPPPPTRQPPNLSFFNNEQTSIFLTPPALANQHGDKYNANNVQRQAYWQNRESD